MTETDQFECVLVEESVLKAKLLRSGLMLEAGLESETSGAEVSYARWLMPANECKKAATLLVLS